METTEGPVPLWLRPACSQPSRAKGIPGWAQPIQRAWFDASGIVSELTIRKLLTSRMMLLTLWALKSAIGMLIRKENR